MHDTIVRPVVIIESHRISQRLGCHLRIATESFQRTGSFKFRAAYHLVTSVPNRCILTASSGNFGQAVAYACHLTGKHAVVVMPASSAAIKIQAVRDYGGQVELVTVNTKSRAHRVAELAAELPDAYVASSYDDDLVIQGNSTLGCELASTLSDLDAIIAPVGGGGLAAGIIQGVREAGCTAKIYGAEPALANDAARSMRAGHIIADVMESSTIADGARTLSLGQRNWTIIKSGLVKIVEVCEDHIYEAMRLLFNLANLKSEPTGALSIGALLSEPNLFKGQRVCCVISGGNLDTALYSSIFTTL